MANRYWVGGTASWDATAGTKWALTSGGTGGEAVPTSADDVFFDGNSGAVTVTSVGGSATAKSIDFTGFTGTFAGIAAVTIANNLTVSAGMTWSASLTLVFTGVGTIISAGKTISSITIDGTSANVTLGDALTSNGTLTVTRGTFNTANYNLTASSFTSTGSITRTVNLGSSVVTLSTNGTPWNTASTSFTFNAGTSQINLTSTGGPSLTATNLTFYNVSFTGSSVSVRIINGEGNTFNNLTLNCTTTAGNTSPFAIVGNQTINGTLTCAGNAATNRLFLFSNTLNTPYTLTAAVLSANDCDFRDITIAGAAANTAPTRAGDCGGNSGIVFPAAKTVYRVGTSPTWVGSNSWALTSGGTGSDNNFPLAQDTVIINNDTVLTGTLTIGSSGGSNIGTFDCSNRTTGITLSFAQTLYVHGSFTLGSGVTTASTGNVNFYNTGTIDFTSAGKTISFPLTIYRGTFRVADAFNSTTSGGLNVTAGTLDANNYNITCVQFGSNNNNVRTITMGSGLWTLTGTSNVWDCTTATNLTLNKNTANILLSNTSTAARSLFLGGKNLNKVTIGGATGTSTLTITSSIAGTIIDELASTKTVAHTIAFSSNNVGFNTWSVTGSAGNVVTVNSITVGTRRTVGLTNATTGIDYLSVKDIGISTANKFYVGANSTDGGNNSNVYFTAAPTGAGNMLMLF